MNNQVLSIEQCKELVSMGIDMSNASMCWVWHQQGEGGYHHLEINRELYPCIKDIPAFTLQDILEMLPDNIVDKDGYTRIQMILPQDNKEVIIAYDNVKQFSGSWIEAAFNMLKWCKENQYI